MTFGERLKKSREEKGYNQKQFAEKLGITATRLNYWEKDKREPDVALIKEIANALDISSDWLIGNDIKLAEFALSDAEKQHIKKYRTLDGYGKKAVDLILDTEYERCTAITAAGVTEIPIMQAAACWRSGPTKTTCTPRPASG